MASLFIPYLTRHPRIAGARTRNLVRGRHHKARNAGKGHSGYSK